MALNSFRFLIFFGALFVALLLLELIKKIAKTNVIAKIQTTILLLFSYGVVFISDWRFCVCILCATLLSYILAISMQKAKTIKAKKSLLAIGVCAFVMMLGYFKYTNFFLESFSALFNITSGTLNIILPVGISFYTFSAIAYLIDVYRGDYSAVRNIIDFALYIAFFPKLVCGPIVRGKVFFPQAENYRGIKAKYVLEGIQIFVFGLFKKIVLADHLGVFVDNVYFAPQAYNTTTVILAVISYSLQIYFDFSGYSDMAIGISKMVGFDFTENFNLPYVAKSFSEFWSRWHISLSSWFRDYLYFPLGGSRKSTLRTCVNLTIVMLVSGLWHGAGITFILWGLLYGITSCVEHIVKSKHKAHKQNSTFGFVKSFGIFVLVTLFWIPFRASSCSNMFDVLKGCFTVHSGVFHPYSWTFFAIICLCASTVFAVIKSKRQGITDKKGVPCIKGYYPIMDLSKFVPLCIFFVFCGLTIILGYFGNTAFIYGNF